MYIYTLIYNEKIIYVGSTIGSMYDRIKSHHRRLHTVNNLLNKFLIKNNITILDGFNIEIFLSHNEQSILPKVKCLDNKIENIAKSLNLKMDQLHTNPDGSFCLTVYPKEKSFFTNGQFNIQEFFINLLESYLYWICYYEKYKQAPWGEYSHGSLGIFEFIAEENLDFKKVYNILKKNNIPLRKLISIYRQNKCICDESKNKNKSESKFRNCHKRSWQGIKKIRALTCAKIKATR